MLEISIYKKWPTFELDLHLTSEREIIGILGASGAGKSMLLRCIAGLVKPDSGRIQVNGRVFFDSEKKINLPPRERKVGFLFQNFALFPHLTVAQNIAFGLEDLPAPQRQAKAEQLMKRFHLKDMGNRYPNQISGGQQQRVALARAMAVEPEILLLDEPFSALDDHLRSHMLKEMEGYLKEFSGSALYVTHHMEEGYRLCNKIAILHSGRVETFDSKQTVFQRPNTLETARITGCKNLIAGERIGDGMIHVPQWEVTLKTSHKGEMHQTGYVGIRANQMSLLSESSGNLNTANRLKVWIADQSELPFKSTLYLKIGSASTDTEDYHLQWEVHQEVLSKIKQLDQPFEVAIEPDDIHWFSK